MAKISIIVPVYNTAKYLERCVDSIVAQTYADWELLLVDDGSTDHSGAICDRYAASDPRIQAFHKPNGGVSSARNLGLDHAQGEWITFVDSDDYIEARFLESFTDNLDADLIIGGLKFLIGITNSKELKLPSLPTGKIESVKYFLESHLTHPLLQGPWAKLYRSSIIKDNNIRFNLSLRLGEDQFFIWDYLKNIPNIYILSTRRENCCDYIYIEPDDFYHKYRMTVEEAVKHILTVNKEYESLGIKSVHYENILVQGYYEYCKNDMPKNGKLWYNNKEIRRLCLRRASNIGRMQNFKTWLVFNLLYPIKIAKLKWQNIRQ